MVYTGYLYNPEQLYRLPPFKTRETNCIKLRLFMRNIVFLLSCLFLSLSSFQGWTNESNSIHWETDFTAAKKSAKEEEKPLFLFFTGSDWCPYCLRFKDQILDQTSFAEMVSDKFIFVELDFPKSKELPPELVKQNQKLKKKYRIQGFPTVIILSHNLDKLASRGYIPVSPEQYASHLLDILLDYQNLSEGIQELNNKELNGKKLQELYKNAKAFRRKGDQEKILAVGLKAEDNVFFLSEKYRFLVDEGLLHEQGTQEIRRELLAKDPENRLGKHRFVALVDFQELAEKFDLGDDPSTVITPLIEYIERFKHQDKENIWRMQMHVAEYLFNGNQIPQALHYANESYESAPEPRKNTIKQAIEHMTAQLGPQDS